MSCPPSSPAPTEDDDEEEEKEEAAVCEDGASGLPVRREEGRGSNERSLGMGIWRVVARRASRDTAPSTDAAAGNVEDDDVEDEEEAGDDDEEGLEGSDATDVSMCVCFVMSAIGCEGGGGTKAVRSSGSAARAERGG